jgi:hypothetical protein
MSTTATTTPTSPLKNGGTRILIDLERELTPEELAKFSEAAFAAGAASLTDHFLNLTLRLPNALKLEGGMA